MTEYDNTNRGSLFPNDKRETDRHPNLKGKADVECPHCGRILPLWVSGWTKMMKDGVRKWLSLSFEPREERAQSPATGETQQPAHNQPQQQPASPQAAHPNVQDDLPF